MRKLIAFMHTSLDGFAAGPNGEMDWIKADESMFDYVEARINKGDTAFYGRVTYQMMEEYWPTAAQQPNASRHDIEHSKWYAKISKIVLSKSMKGQSHEKVHIISENIADEINKIKQKDGPEILIFGSPSATHALMELDLIDGYWLFVNPIVLGKGIPVFGNIKEPSLLKLVTSQTLDSGVIALSYERQR